jgi:hypothetical protein
MQATLQILFLFFVFGFSNPAMAEPKNESCAYLQCSGSNCGCALRKKGWKEVARCSGHEWRYLLEKGEKRKLCEGINARGGPTENPCSDFAGKLSDFKRCYEVKSEK